MSAAPSQLSSSLDWPPFWIWSLEPGFSHDVDRHINAGFLALAQAGHVADAHLRAYQAASRTMKRSQSLRQRLRGRYVLGAALVGGGATALGLDHLDISLDIAEELLDDGAAIRIAHLAGGAERGRSHFRRGQNLEAYSLERLRALSIDGMSADPSLELDICNGLAGCEFFLDRYTPARALLDEAQRVSEQVPAHKLGIALTYWIQALLLRWRGHPDWALRYVMEASSIYERAETPNARSALGRIKIVLADIAFDIAESVNGPVAALDRGIYLELAQQSAQQGYALAEETGDINGLQTARLALIRRRRGASGRTNAQRTIEDVITHARQMNDMSMLCQGQTALGRVLDNQARHDAALNVYHAALDTAEDYEMPALGSWARRAVLAADETKA